MKRFLATAVLGMGMLGSFAVPTLVTRIHYGEKANDSMKNPCRGECVRVCAQIQELVDVPEVPPISPINPVAPTAAGGSNGTAAGGSNGTMVISRYLDEDGNAIMKETYYIYDVDSFIKSRTQNVPDNCVVTVTTE